MTVRPEHFAQFTETPAMHIMAVIVDQYGRKMADDIAREVMSKKPRPVVQWPTF